MLSRIKKIMDKYERSVKKDDTSTNSKNDSSILNKKAGFKLNFTNNLNDENDISYGDDLNNLNDENDISYGDDLIDLNDENDISYGNDLIDLNNLNYENDISYGDDLNNLNYENDISLDNINLKNVEKLFYFAKNKQEEENQKEILFQNIGDEFFENNKQKIYFNENNNEAKNVAYHDCFYIEFQGDLNKDELSENKDIIELSNNKENLSNLKSGYLPITKGFAYKLPYIDFIKNQLIIQSKYVNTTILLKNFNYMKVGALHLNTNKNKLLISVYYNSKVFTKYELNKNLIVDNVINKSHRFRLLKLLELYECKDFEEFKKILLFILQQKINQNNKKFNILSVKVNNVNINKTSFSKLSYEQLKEVEELNNSHVEVLEEVIKKFNKD